MRLGNLRDRASVLFRYTREEEFIANTSSRRESHRQTGSEKDGRLTAVKMDFRANTGPYGNHSLTVPCNGPALSLPLYPCDNVDFQVTTYYSNICPNGAYQVMAHRKVTSLSPWH